MKKIPVKIIEFADGDKMIQEVMIDLVDTMQLGIDPGKKIDKFRDKYFELVKKAQKLFYGKNHDKKKKRQTLPSSTYWKLGNLLGKFNDDIKNDFEITNYALALQRDFGLSDRYVRELIIFSKVFKEKEILDSIPMAIYRALIWKKTQLEEINMLEKEKHRLLKRGKANEFIGRENYKTELNKIILKHKTKKNLKKKASLVVMLNV